MCLDINERISTMTRFRVTYITEQGETKRKTVKGKTVAEAIVIFDDWADAQVEHNNMKGVHGSYMDFFGIEEIEE